MVTVLFPATLRPLVGGASQIDVSGGTALEALRRLEREHPRFAGWVLDERGLVRPHVSLFVNDEQAGPERPVGPGDLLHIVPAISGGVGGGTDANGGVRALVGTRKGLFVLDGERGGRLDLAARRFAGQTVEYAVRDPATGRVFASVTHGQFGQHLFFTDDPLAPEAEWQEARGPAFPEDAGATVQRIWIVEPGEAGVLWAGVAPAALFRSEDGGATWALNRGLWDQPARPSWQGGAGGLCLHSICPWPGDPSRLAVGISAAGVWRTEDGGANWTWGVSGLVPRYVPEEARATTIAFCIHNLRRAPLQPETLYMQFHGGVYRSDDAGATWIDIAAGLPCDFGFPIALDPRDPDRAYVIPMIADVDRVTPEGKLRVYETRDRGRSWRALTRGLPQEGCWATILRQAFCQDGGDPLGLYFGTESGELWASADAGDTWTLAADHLPPILAVRAGSA